MPPTPLIGVLSYDELLHACEHFARDQSHDPRTQVAAMIVNAKGSVIAAGANRIPSGVECLPRRVQMPLKRPFIEHAERAAIFHAAKHGLRLDTGTMVAPWAACAECARAIIAAGISCLVRRPIPPSSWSYSIGLGDAMLREAGVDIVELPHPSQGDR